MDDKTKVIIDEALAAGDSQRQAAVKAKVSRGSVQNYLREKAVQVPESAGGDVVSAAGDGGETGQVDGKLPAPPPRPSELHPAKPGALLPPLPTPETRLRALLVQYTIKNVNVETVIDYVSSFPGAFEDMTRLSRLLQDCGVSVSSAMQLVRHFAVKEGLSLPSTIDALGYGGHGPDTPRRFSVVNGTVVPDSEGELTINEAIKIAALDRQPQGQGQPNVESSVLREQLAAQSAELSRLRETMDRRQEAETSALRVQVEALRARPAPGARTELDLMSEGLSKLDKGFGELKTTAIELLTKAAPPMSAAERAMMTGAVSEESARVIAKQVLGEKIFGAKEKSRDSGINQPIKINPPAPAPAETEPTPVSPAGDNSQAGYGQTEGGQIGIIKDAAHIAEIKRRRAAPGVIIQTGMAAGH